MLADWGDGSPLESEGGRVRLWLNDGAAHFTDVTPDRMRTEGRPLSWDVEQVTSTTTGDLDLAVS